MESIYISIYIHATIQGCISMDREGGYPKAILPVVPCFLHSMSSPLDTMEKSAAKKGKRHCYFKISPISTGWDIVGKTQKKRYRYASHTVGPSHGNYQRESWDKSTSYCKCVCCQGKTQVLILESSKEAMVPSEKFTNTTRRHYRNGAFCECI